MTRGEFANTDATAWPASSKGVNIDAQLGPRVSLEPRDDALVGGTLISAVAASTVPATPAPIAAAAAAPSGPAALDVGEYCANFRAAFAANLGVSEAEMTAAARKAAISTIDKAVADGDMTKAAGNG